MPTLVLAMKPASADLKEKITKSLSSRAAEGLQDELDTLGSVRLKEVEAAQEAVIAIVRKLEDDGEITIGGDDELSNFVCLTQPLIDVQIRGGAASSEIQDHDLEDKPAHLSEEALAAIKAEAFDAGVVEGEKRMLDACAQDKKQLLENWAHLTEGLAQAKSEMLEQLQSCLPDLLAEGVGQILQAWSRALIS